MRHFGGFWQDYGGVVKMVRTKHMEEKTHQLPYIRERIGASAGDLDGYFCDAIRVDKMCDWFRLHGLYG